MPQGLREKPASKVNDRRLVMTADRSQNLRRLFVEVVLVDLGVVLPFVGDSVLGEDRAHRTYRLAGAAVDALIRMDEVHVVCISRIDTVHGTNVQAARIL